MSIVVPAVCGGPVGLGDGSHDSLRRGFAADSVRLLLVCTERILDPNNYRSKHQSRRDVHECTHIRRAVHKRTRAL